MSSFTDLHKKYKGFLVPACKIESDGAELSQSTLLIDSIVVSNSIGDTAGSCRFTVGGIYERGARTFSSAAVNKLKPGCKIKLSLGYGSDLTEVFAGYIDETGFSFNENNACICVHCLDARALMRHGATLAIGNDDKTTMQSVINTILKKYGAVVSVGEVTLEELENDAHNTVEGSDLEIILKAAQERGKRFYIEGGKAYIAAADDTVCVEFGWEQCSMEFGVRYLSRKYIAKGYDNSKMENFSAELEVKAKTAQNDLMTVENTVMLSPSQLGDAAKALLKGKADNDKNDVFRGTLSCRGLPELKLGKKVKINDFPLLSVSKTDTFTVASVKHELSSQSGFNTQLEIEG